MKVFVQKNKLDAAQDTINTQAQEILRLQTLLIASQENYHALEQGMNELQEGHEQIYLDFHDALKAVMQKNVELLQKVQDHEQFCLQGLDIKNTGLDEDVPTTERQDHAEQ